MSVIEKRKKGPCLHSDKNIDHVFITCLCQYAVDITHIRGLFKKYGDNVAVYHIFCIIGIINKLIHVPTILIIDIRSFTSFDENVFFVTRF